MNDLDTLFDSRDALRLDKGYEQIILDQNTPTHPVLRRLKLLINV